MNEKEESELLRLHRMDVLGQLSAGIAHDFNNIVASMYASLDMLAEEEDRARSAELIENLKKSVLLARELIKSWSRHARNDVPKPRKVSVNEVVGHLRPILESAVGSRGKIRFELGWENPIVEVERVLLESALLNLVLNARDALQRRGDIVLSTAQHIGSGEAWIVVKDEGCGMTPEVAEKACEPRFTTKKEGQGMGLGLSMVQQFVRRAQGRLEIDSRENEGTEITIVLPVVDAFERNDRETETHEERGAVILELPRKTAAGGAEL